MKILHDVYTQGVSRLQGCGMGRLVHIQQAMCCACWLLLYEAPLPSFSLTFGTYGARRSLQTPLPWPSWLPHRACPTWKPIFSRRPWGPGSALRGLRVRRGHLGQEVGEFGCGVRKPERHFMKEG